ncbi:MAG: hypothetical protein JST93_26750 [Acidobacteria bacterium]|nr:hypothetical protein [Acidobacteriota bacterium]
MRKYWIACLLPVLAVVVFNVAPKPFSPTRERFSPAQKSMKIYDMERHQEEMNRTLTQFRSTDSE